MIRPFVATKLSRLGRCAPASRPTSRAAAPSRERARRGRRVEVELVEPALVLEELQEPHEGVLGVGVAHDVPAQEVGQRRESLGRTRSNASIVPSWANSQRRKRKGWVFSSFALPDRGVPRVHEQRLRVELADELGEPERLAARPSAASRAGRSPRRSARSRTRPGAGRRPAASTWRVEPRHLAPEQVRIASGGSRRAHPWIHASLFWSGGGERLLATPRVITPDAGAGIPAPNGRAPEPPFDSLSGAPLGCPNPAKRAGRTRAMSDDIAVGIDLGTSYSASPP